ncbi:hypothetical protein DL96DRAFT_1792502 [Flagelloscypha sp. PMI_526]|nr:hypothetical protein DL96DRAFT_1792502 [Flagelloscypha sp. PMI_526]
MQNSFALGMTSAPWMLDLSTHWDVLGPFPQSAREQQVPIPILAFRSYFTHPVDFDQLWPSSYADGGEVKWSKASSSNSGELKVTFPEIRWQNLLDFEGWAALQHHAVLRSTFTIYPSSTTTLLPTHIEVRLVEASYFAILPIEKAGGSPKWYAGDIYALPRVRPRRVPLPVLPSHNEPTTYEIWVSGDYEIRLFGRSSNPTQSLTVQISLPDTNLQPNILFISPRTIVPDFVDGWAFGTAVGITLQNLHTHEWARVLSIKGGTTDEFTLSLLSQTSLAPSQTRVIPISIAQKAPFLGHSLNFTLLGETLSGSKNFEVPVSLHISRLTLADTDSPWSLISSVKGTHFYADTMPSIYYAIPPLVRTCHSDPQPAILALHGAGVDILDTNFWQEELPRNDESWIVVTTGRTSWGLDWHGPSLISSMEAVESLKTLLTAKQWDEIDAQHLVLLDMILGAIPAAGYIKSTTVHTFDTVSVGCCLVLCSCSVLIFDPSSAHFIDPALRAILDTSLTPDDNDLHLSNLVNTPILAIHGGDDDNVPTWHSREAFNVLKAWNTHANVTYKEDAGQLHWYNGVVDNKESRTFIDNLLHHQQSKEWVSFTLTVSIPAEQGSLHGIRILELEMPGRLGRLEVYQGQGLKGQIKTRNIYRFSIDPRTVPFIPTAVDGLTFPPGFDGQSSIITMVKINGKWQNVVEVDEQHIAPLPSSRIQSILNSNGPLRLIIDEKNPQSLDAALRIAHDLDVYHELDAEIVSSSDAVRAGVGNIVFIGDSSYAREVLAREQTGFGLSEDGLILKETVIEGSGLATLFLHPHPSSRDKKAMALFVHWSGDVGLERALRLFPIRTGITVPNWIISGPRSDTMGTAGVIGAGVWTRDWQYNDVLSWFYN